MVATPWVRLSLLALLLGLLTTLLASVLLAYRGGWATPRSADDWGGRYIWHLEEPVLHVFSRRSHGCWYLGVRRVNRPPAEARQELKKAALPYSTSMPVWARSREAAELSKRLQAHNSGLTVELWSEFATGWPLPAARWVMYQPRLPFGPNRGRTVGAFFTYLGAAEAPAWLVKLAPPTRLGVIPYDFWWPGLVANTLCLAALWLLLLWTPFLLRARWRRRRGSCGNCGHRLLEEQIVCPECGRKRRGARQPTKCGAAVGSR
ncbi:MAG: hypothetical protein ACF8NJ_03685 [Phycisphaerales bacterium JB038]